MILDLIEEFSFKGEKDSFFSPWGPIFSIHPWSRSFKYKDAKVNGYLMLICEAMGVKNHMKELKFKVKGELRVREFFAFIEKNIIVTPVRVRIKGRVFIVKLIEGWIIGFKKIQFIILPPTMAPVLKIIIGYEEK